MERLTKDTLKVGVVFRVFNYPGVYKMLPGYPKWIEFYGHDGIFQKKYHLGIEHDFFLLETSFVGKQIKAKVKYNNCFVIQEIEDFLLFGNDKEFKFLHEKKQLQLFS